VVVPVPPGTVLRDAATGELLRDFGKEPGRWVFLSGGRGGWGNVHFKSPVNQAPRKALPGQQGGSRKLRVELQVMADLGLVGFPNAGKSSLLDRLTNARPRIAAYPFTTKIPNLGVLSLGSAHYEDRRDIVIADIPGLIEGASGGAGLGIRFLKHISRTRALVFLIDLSDESWSGAFDIVYNELEAFSPELIRKKRLIVGTKLDLAGTAERLAELRAMFAPEPVLGISVFSGEGLPALAAAFSALAGEAEAAEAVGEAAAGEPVREETEG
jgi:GTP-binding protein